MLVGGNVIIVIGGDDNYKSKEQEEQLSRPGPEELSVYSSAKNISMEEKASYFPGVKNTDPFTWKL